MAASLLLNDWRQGRNNFDPPHTILDTQVVEAVNVDWYGASLARRRGGSTQLNSTGGTSIGTPVRLHRFLPGRDDSTSELFSVSENSPVLVKRLAGGTSWADVTGGALIATGTGAEAETTSLDGKLWIAAKATTGSRLLVYDPTLATPQIRYVGFSTPGTPTLTNTGSGSYVITIWVRIRWLQYRWNGASFDSVIVRMSEPSTAATFTSSGSGTAIRITRPTAPGVGETHWTFDISLDGTTYYEALLFGAIIADTPIANTTYDYSATSSSFPGNTTGNLAPDIGEYATWTDMRFIISDGNRLIGGGSHQTGEKTSRIFFSAVLGATDRGDLERVPINDEHENFVDLNENDGGGLTGLAKAMNGAFYAFKRRHIYRLNPTGDNVTPYIPRLITTAFGAISQASITAGRDIYGNPAIYFWSEEGPCRLTIQGDGASVVQYLGEDIRDYTSLMTFTASGALSYGQGYPFALYYGAKHQVWFFFTYQTGGNSIPVKAVFDIMQGTLEVGEYVRGGWSLHTTFDASPVSLSHGAAGGVLFSRTPGATMSSDQVPYVVISSASVILRCDTADTTDNAQNFQAYVRSKPLNITQFGDNVGIGVCSLLADPASGVTITLSLVRDYGLETRTSTVSLTAAGSETKVIRKFEDAEISGAGVVQVQLGDAAAGAFTQWKLHELALTVFPQEPR